MIGRSAGVAILAAALVALPAQGTDRPAIRIEAISLTGAVQSLTSRPGGVDTAPAVSMRTGAIAFVSDRGGPLDVYVMSARGTGVRRVTTGPLAADPSGGVDASVVSSNDAGTTSIAWSPDGKRLAFDAQNATFSPSCFTNCVDWRVFTIGVDGTGLRLVSDQARSPAWSPDGTKLAMEGSVDPYGASEAMQVETVGGTVSVVVHAESPDSSRPPSWSRRGAVAFQAFRADVPPLFVQTIGPATFDVHVLGVGSHPAWSPDGRQLAFVRGGRLLVTDAGGRKPRGLSRITEFASLPAWSPDGRRIAFLVRASSKPAQLAVVTVATRAERVLTRRPSGSFFDTAPVWSRDGSRIVVAVSGD